MRQARHCITALAALTVVSALVGAAWLAAVGELRGLAVVVLGVCVTAPLIGLDVAWRSLEAARLDLDRMASERDAARRASLTDALTGLGNRRQFELRLGEAVVGALRYGEPFSVALFDLDDFKRVNDRVGHAAGDAALRHVAAVLAAGSRELDVACRWGGEEFVLLLPRTDAADAARVAERALRTLRGTIADAGGVEMRITASAGVAAFPTDGPDGPSVVDAADAALLQAKASGKDQVRRARPAVIDLTGRERAPHASA